MEIDGIPYCVAAFWDRLWVATVGGDTWHELDLRSARGERPNGIYLYVTSPPTGTSQEEPVVHVLLLKGGSENYPSGQNYYVRTDRASVTATLGR